MKKRQSLISLSEKENWHRLKYMKFYPKTRKHFFLLCKCWIPWPREVIEPPSLEVQKTGVVLGNLLWLPLLEQGDGLQKPFPTSIFL